MRPLALILALPALVHAGLALDELQGLRSEPAPQAASPGEAVPVILVDNFGVVADGLYRGRRLDGEKDYQFLAGTLGVETIVNLRYLHSDDEKLCAAHGLTCARFPLRLILKDEHFDWRTFRRAFDFVVAERAAGRKVYIHCDHGSDRTGALAAALTIRERACGKDFDKDALWEQTDKTLKDYGFHERYRRIHAEIKSWVYDLSANAWLCR